MVLMAFQQLSTVTQQLIRRKAWAELNEQLVVRVITKMFERLGLVITKRKLGQAIPVVGVVIGAGLNASYLQSVGRDAELAYRMCFLAEKHGLDPSDLAPPPTADDATGAGDYNRHPGDRRRRAAEARTGGRRPGVLTLFVLS